MNRLGVSLLEMTVVLLLLAVIAGVSGAALSSLRLPAGTSVARQLLAGRSRALLTGAAVRIERKDSSASSSQTPVLFLPDGRAIGNGVDPILGVIDRRAP